MSALSTALATIGGTLGAVGSGTPGAMGQFVQSMGQQGERALDREWAAFEKQQDRMFQLQAQKSADALTMRRDKMKHGFDMERLQEQHGLAVKFAGIAQGLKGEAATVAYDRREASRKASQEHDLKLAKANNDARYAIAVLNASATAGGTAPEEAATTVASATRTNPALIQVAGGKLPPEVRASFSAAIAKGDHLGAGEIFTNHVGPTGFAAIWRQVNSEYGKATEIDSALVGMGYPIGDVQGMEPGEKQRLYGIRSREHAAAQTYIAGQAKLAQGIMQMPAAGKDIRKSRTNYESALGQLQALKNSEGHSQVAGFDFHVFGKEEQFNVAQEFIEGFGGPPLRSGGALAPPSRSGGSLGVEWQNLQKQIDNNIQSLETGQTTVERSIAGQTLQEHLSEGNFAGWKGAHLTAFRDEEEFTDFLQTNPDVQKLVARVNSIANLISMIPKNADVLPGMPEGVATLAFHFNRMGAELPQGGANELLSMLYDDSEGGITEKGRKHIGTFLKTLANVDPRRMTRAMVQYDQFVKDRDIAEDMSSDMFARDLVNAGVGSQTFLPPLENGTALWQSALVDEDVNNKYAANLPGATQEDYMMKAKVFSKERYLRAPGVHKAFAKSLTRPLFSFDPTMEGGYSTETIRSMGHQYLTWLENKHKIVNKTQTKEITDPVWATFINGTRAQFDKALAAEGFDPAGAEPWIKGTMPETSLVPPLSQLEIYHHSKVSMDPKRGRNLVVPLTVVGRESTKGAGTILRGLRLHARADLQAPMDLPAVYDLIQRNNQGPQTLPGYAESLGGTSLRQIPRTQAFGEPDSLEDWPGTQDLVRDFRYRMAKPTREAGVLEERDIPKAAIDPIIDAGLPEGMPEEISTELKRAARSSAQKLSGKAFWAALGAAAVVAPMPKELKGGVTEPFELYLNPPKGVEPRAWASLLDLFDMNSVVGSMDAELAARIDRHGFEGGEWYGLRMDDGRERPYPYEPGGSLDPFGQFGPITGDPRYDNHNFYVPPRAYPRRYSDEWFEQEMYGWPPTDVDPHPEIPRIPDAPLWPENPMLPLPTRGWYAPAQPGPGFGPAFGAEEMGPVDPSAYDTAPPLYPPGGGGVGDVRGGRVNPNQPLTVSPGAFERSPFSQLLQPSQAGESFPQLASAQYEEVINPRIALSEAFLNTGGRIDTSTPAGMAAKTIYTHLKRHQTNGNGDILQRFNAGDLSIQELLDQGAIPPRSDIPYSTTLEETRRQHTEVVAALTRIQGMVDSGDTSRQGLFRDKEIGPGRQVQMVTRKTLEREADILTSRAGKLQLLMDAKTNPVVERAGRILEDIVLGVGGNKHFSKAVAGDSEAESKKEKEGKQGVGERFLQHMAGLGTAAREEGFMMPGTATQDTLDTWKAKIDAQPTLYGQFKACMTIMKDVNHKVFLERTTYTQEQQQYLRNYLDGEYAGIMNDLEHLFVSPELANLKKGDQVPELTHYLDDPAGGFFEHPEWNEYRAMVWWAASRRAKRDARPLIGVHRGGER